MKKTLLALAACIATSGLCLAGVRTMEVSIESIGLTTSGATMSKKVLLSQEQDGITVTYYGGYYSTRTAFYYPGSAGNVLSEDATSLPCFFAVTENKNGYKIKSVSLNPTYSMASPKYQLGIADSQPTLDTSSKTNYLTPSQWTPDVSESGFTLGVTKTLELSKPSEYFLIANPGTSTLSYFDTVTIYYEDNDPRQTPTMAFENSSLVIDTTAPEAELQLNTNIPAEEITWTVSPDNGGLLCDNGKLTAVTRGKYVVTASFAGNDTYAPAAAKANVEVMARIAPLFQFSEEKLEVALNSSKNMGSYIERDSNITDWEWSVEPIGESPADGAEMTFAYFKATKDGEYYVVATFAGDATYLPAVAKMKIIAGNGLQTGIDTIEADANAEYFNLQGVRIDANSLGKGIYLVRKGGKVTKVIR